MELKELPKNLQYLFLGQDNTYPAIISKELTEEQVGKLSKVLWEHRGAIGWTITDLKGISPSICNHKIFLEEDAKPIRKMQRQLNLNMHEVVKKEVRKLLDIGVIYPILDCPWVSLTQVVPKKARITIVPNQEEELVLTRVTSGWRMCIDYRQLNSMTRKDHFPLPFMDQLLERVAGHNYYYFLDGYSGYNQIEVNSKD